MRAESGGDRAAADSAYEEQARRMFALDLTPEEYAARHAHEWLCFSFDEYRFSDERLDAWIQRLGDIFFRRNGAPSLDDLRRRFLTEEERAAIAQREREEY
jgi:hypothetical protein